MKKVSLERRINRVGYYFMLPWIIGIIYFFVISFFKSVLYAFSDVSLGDSGIELNYVGVENFKHMLLQDSDYNRSVIESIQGMLLNVPIILFFSLFVALILNQKFKGRTVARALFFLPIIIASGMVIRVIQSDVFVKSGMAENATIFQAGAIKEILYQMNLGTDMVDAFATLTGQIFDLSWKSGFQILLYLSALQTIPQVYYEVASVEGANAWDAFWKITFPVLSPTSLLVLVYTVIDTFVDYNNTVMMDIFRRIDDFKYGYASASALLYFIVISLILMLIYVIARKRVSYIGN